MLLQLRFERMDACAVIISLIMGPTIAGSALAATFTPLGYLPDGYFYSEADGVSADGRVVVGIAHHGGLGNEAFRWTAETGIQGLGDFPTGNFESYANAVSADGSTIVGVGTAGASADTDAFRWTAANGLQQIGYLPNSLFSFQFSNSYGVSGDGSTVVGGSGNKAFRWTQTEGMVRLNDLPDGIAGSIATDISLDGNVIVGSMASARALYEPFRWTAGTGMVGLGFLPGITPIENDASAVSADGTTIIGTEGPHSWRWTAETGMVELPTLAGKGALPSDVSGDGSVIVGGTSANGPEGRSPAFIWTSQGGTQNLQLYLQQKYGLTLGGWLLTNANAVSDNGTVIVGTGWSPTGRPQAWVINLAVPEPSSAALFAFAAMIFGMRRSRTRSS